MGQICSPSRHLPPGPKSQSRLREGLFWGVCVKVPETTRRTLSTFSLPIGEDFWLFLDFLSDRSIFSTAVGGYKNTAIAEKREENPEIVTN